MGQWIWRNSHYRGTKFGGMTHVREHFAFSDRSKKKRGKRSNTCPYCKARILSQPMPNGGWGHFEYGTGLSRIKHPCFTIGNGMSKVRPDGMEDLFDRLPI